jgi:hypothetical protein
MFSYKRILLWFTNVLCTNVTYVNIFYITFVKICLQS